MSTNKFFLIMLIGVVLLSIAIVIIIGTVPVEMSAAEDRIIIWYLLGRF